MKDLNDIERMVQEAANKIEEGDADKRLKAIEDRLEIKQNVKKPFWKRWQKITLISAPLCVALVLAIVLPITLSKVAPPDPDTPPEEHYFREQLGVIAANKNEFYTSLEKANIIPVQFEDNLIQSYALLKTNSMLVKGGNIEIIDDLNNPTMYANISFYDTTVMIKESLYEDYNLRYEISETTILYKLNEFIEEEGIESYSYSAIAWHNNLTYIITYDTMENNILSYFDSLFKD